MNLSFIPPNLLLPPNPLLSYFHLQPNPDYLIIYKIL